MVLASFCLPENRWAPLYCTAAAAFALTTNPELAIDVDVSSAMRTRNLKVTTDNLRIGMFVAELDLPWLGMPFPLQGVLIDDLPA
jgi:Domain of unknown function (DUF3391)